MLPTFFHPGLADSYSTVPSALVIFIGPPIDIAEVRGSFGRLRLLLFLFPRSSFWRLCAGVLPIAFSFHPLLLFAV